MQLRAFDTFIKSDGVKPMALAVVGLAFMFSGCAVSEKRQSSDYSADASANRWKVIAAARKGGPSSDKGGGATADEDFDLLEEELVEQKVEIADPLEPVNRIMYSLNDTLYFWVVKPVAEFYTDVAPEPARIGIRNFFNNLTTPVRLVNCLLQGKGHAAGNEVHRFVVNTTIGVLGLGDPAQDKFGFKPTEEDLGQTLGLYGLGDGFYIVWPLLGPSTLRDSAGRLGDAFLNPVFYLEPDEAAIGVSAGKNINDASFHIGEYEAFKADAVEPYIAMRQAYIQYRKKQIHQ
ncbi:MAG TPA: VacJ family lipoprotein [Sedimentisphaerales bacterium]|nr:VacJ family lipoprotein [Sedimentisphaerales bacterium]